MSIVIRARTLRVRERQAHDLVVVVISLCSSVIRGLRLPWLESREVGCIGFSQLALPNARTWNPTARSRREKFVDPGRTASILIASGMRQPARKTTVAAAPGALTGCSVTVSSAWGD